VRGARRRINKLEDLVEELKDSMEVLTRCAVDLVGDFPVISIIGVLRCAVAMNEPYPPLLWERCLRRLNRVTAAPSATANVSPWEAASLLELIPFCPRNVTVEYTLERPLLWPFGQHKQEVKVDEVQDLYPGLRVRNPPWHRLAGRLAALTSTQAPILKDRAHLINACWALAMLGHPNRLLLRTVRKTVQFALHELSASVLARLVVAVAVEEASGAVGDFAGSSLSTSAKLDREFVDQVALGVFKSAADIRPLSVQISALVAAAGLGAAGIKNKRPSRYLSTN
jgi:hypothetical protein